MPHTSHHILIFGATGAIGTYITEEILKAKSLFSKIGIFTSQTTVDSKPNQITALQEQGVEVITGSVDNDKDVTKAYANYDTVISTVGRNVILKQIDLIRLAEASNTIKRFFPSEYGTDIEYSPQSATEKPHQQKLKVRAYIRSHVERLEITYLVTGPYSDMALNRGVAIDQGGGYDVLSSTAVIVGTGDERISYTSMKDTGVLLVAALTHSEASRNRILIVNSFTTTAHDVVKEYEKQTGTKWNVRYISLDELKKREKEAWDHENPIATLFTLRRIWTEGGTIYEGRDNGLLGEPKVDTLEDQVAKLIKQAELK